MPLTDTAIRVLKPKATRYSRTDERGLVLEVFPTGGMLWHYRYRLNGKQERVTLGRYPALSLKLARAERDKRETLVAQGQSPAVQKRLTKQGAAPDTTVAEFGERFFRDVTNEDVRAIIWKKKDEGFDAAAGNIRSVLKRLFDYAQTAGLVDTNPVLALPMRHVHKAKARERALAGGSELVMPGRGSLTKPFAHNSINTALKTAPQGQDIPAFTIHDLRRTASTLLHEHGWPSDVVEKALNHTIGGVRGVYNRAEYAPQRREMLQFWADTIERLMTAGQVVVGRFKQVA